MDLAQLGKRASGWLKRMIMGLGLVALAMVLLSFTSLPFRAHRWLGVAGGLAKPDIEAIVVLSGSGMPSGPELMRCHEAAYRAQQAPHATIILLLPLDTALDRAMTQELITKRVSPKRIRALLHGRNTREQAMDLATSLPEWQDRSIALVTAPENMYRSLLTFRKLGFTDVNGAPTFDHALFSSLEYSHRQIGGKPYLPDMANQGSLRYNFWNYLKLEITCLREYTALAYYKLNGWI